MATVERTTSDIQLVVFRLQNELLGLNIAAVKEIITWRPLTRLPLAPATAEGIMNLRGQLIPVVDLRKTLGAATEAANDAHTRIIVIEHGEHVVGLVVDGVSEVLRVPADRIEPSTHVMSGLQAGLISGIAKIDTGLVLLLEPSSLMKASGLEG